ncbi:hypothetical protein DUNSADRAFT_9330 [Dunaliella salina]|uniref:Uncharacterized protein n=1 Tax=Dunaliella salina TaxID=3046 RepID=A0ABQ7H5F4_DUNSA|nr:hypothetical protein DUNSADRAFT_9330 [Dunaliella salina]|eukprot:KAF5842071.1 hypothetical protein DUNSADRAFT_9330 [Dunaliella salina]
MFQFWLAGWAGPVCEGQVAEDLVTPCHYDEMTYAHGRGTSGLGIVQPGHWKYLILSILDPNNSTVCSDNNGNGIDNDFGDPDQKARCWARLHARPLLFNLAAQHRWEKKTVWDWYSRSGTVLEPFYNDQAAKKQGIDSRNMSGDHCCDSNLETFFIVKPFDPATSVGENFFLDSQAIVLTPGKVQVSYPFFWVR